VTSALSEGEECIADRQPIYITYVDQKELARVVGRESVPLLESRLLAVK
jgi:hypothetical protein